MPAKVASGRHVALVTPADLYAGVSKQLVRRHHFLLSTNLLPLLTCNSHHYQPLRWLRLQAIVLCQLCCCASLKMAGANVSQTLDPAHQSEQSLKGRLFL